jgi:hypothetical protein
MGMDEREEIAISIIMGCLVRQEELTQVVIIPAGPTGVL